MVGPGLGVLVDDDARPVGQEPDRVDEVEVLGRPDESDRVARRLAAEAVVEALLGVDAERRRLLLVERAETRPAPTALPQGRMLADQRHDVGRRPDLGDVLIGDGHARRVPPGCPAACRRPPPGRPIRLASGRSDQLARSADQPGRSLTGPVSARLGLALAGPALAGPRSWPSTRSRRSRRRPARPGRRPAGRRARGTASSSRSRGRRRRTCRSTRGRRRARRRRRP